MRKRLLIIVITFCVSFLIMIAISVVSMKRFLAYTSYSNFSDTSSLALQAIYQTEVHIRDIDRFERGYMLTKDTMYKRFVFNTIDSLHNDIIDIDFLTDDNPSQQKYIDILKDTIALRVAAVKLNINYVDTVKRNTLSKYFYDSRELMRACSRELRIIHIEENNTLQKHQKSEHIYETLTSNTITYLIAIFCLVTLVLFAVMIKELIGRLRYQEELQAKVIDLKRSHIELEEIAYSASHDLQEPLRKIQVFSNMLLFQHNGKFEEENKETLKKINTLANKMQFLISDILSLTSLTKIDEQPVKIDINRIIQYVLIDNNEKITDKNANVIIDKLPVFKGYEIQLKMLFNALIDNSLKFTKPDVLPVISIMGKVVKGKELIAINPNLKSKKYYQITFADNGIGFDNQFVNKMFRLFQQITSVKTESEGKGIGLAICQRIMANHKGYIIAEGKIGVGAMFYLYFPVEEIWL